VGFCDDLVAEKVTRYCLLYFLLPNVLTYDAVDVIFYCKCVETHCNVECIILHFTYP